MNKSKKILSVALVILISGFTPFFNISSKSIDVENDLKNVYVTSDSKDDAKSGQKKKNNSIKGIFCSLAKKSNLLIYAPILAAVVGYGLWALDDKMLPDYENCEFNPKKIIEQARCELKIGDASGFDVKNYDFNTKTEIIKHIATHYLSRNDNFLFWVRIGIYFLGNILNWPLDVVNRRDCREKMEQEVRRFQKSSYGLCFRYVSIMCLICRELNTNVYICIEHSSCHAYIIFSDNEKKTNQRCYYSCHLPFAGRMTIHQQGSYSVLRNATAIAKLDTTSEGKPFRDIVFYSPVLDESVYVREFVEKVVDNEERSNSGIAYTESRLPLFFGR